MKADLISFLASFAPMQSAIKAGDDGMRITLDIPESEMTQAVLLLSMRNKVLRISIEAASNQLVNNRKSARERVNNTQDED